MSKKTWVCEYCGSRERDPEGNCHNCGGSKEVAAQEETFRVLRRLDEKTSGRPVDMSDLNTKLDELKNLGENLKEYPYMDQPATKGAFVSVANRDRKRVLQIVGVVAAGLAVMSFLIWMFITLRNVP